MVGFPLAATSCANRSIGRGPAGGDKSAGSGSATGLGGSKSCADDALIGVGTTRLSARAVSFSNASLAAAVFSVAVCPPDLVSERQGRWRRHRLDMAPQRLVIDFRVADQCAHACLFPYGPDILGSSRCSCLLPHTW